MADRYQSYTNIEELLNWVFKASAHWAVAFYKSKCPFMCPSICLCVFTFEVPFKRLFAPISQNRMSKNFRDWRTWGKVMERSGAVSDPGIHRDPWKTAHIFVDLCTLNKKILLRENYEKKFPIRLRNHRC